MRSRSWPQHWQRKVARQCRQQRALRNCEAHYAWSTCSSSFLPWSAALPQGGCRPRTSRVKRRGRSPLSKTTELGGPDYCIGRMLQAYSTPARGLPEAACRRSFSLRFQAAAALFRAIAITSSAAGSIRCMWSMCAMNGIRSPGDALTSGEQRAHTSTPPMSR